MQMAVVEFARNVVGLKDASSTEFDRRTKNPVIHIMDTQKDVKKKGGTMRLGAYPCKIKENTLAEKVYKSNEISERHRHRLNSIMILEQKLKKQEWKFLVHHQMIY